MMTLVQWCCAVVWGHAMTSDTLFKWRCTRCGWQDHFKAVAWLQQVLQKRDER